MERRLPGLYLKEISCPTFNTYLKSLARPGAQRGPLEHLALCYLTDVRLYVFQHEEADPEVIHAGGHHNLYVRHSHGHCVTLIGSLPYQIRPLRPETTDLVSRLRSSRDDIFGGVHEWWGSQEKR